jgi:hypothetical protein
MEQGIVNLLFLNFILKLFYQELSPKSISFITNKVAEEEWTLGESDSFGNGGFFQE